MLLQFRFKGKTVELDVSENWNILFLKQRVCMELEIDSQACFLTFNGTQLDEWDKVSIHKIQDGDILDVCAHGAFRHFYVLCYVCDTVVPAEITIHCDVCKGIDFFARPTAVPSNRSVVSGMCRTPACNGSQATVSMACSHNQSHQPTTYLNQITANIEKSTCVACCSNECDIIISFCPSKGHILCLDCFRSYAENYLDTRNFKLIPHLGYTLGCPVGCPDVYISDTHHFRILGSQFYSRYKEIAAHQICYTDAFCNCPRCDTCWEIPSDPGSFHWVFCEGPFGCGAEFCTRCRNLVLRRSANTGDNSKLSCFCDALEGEAEAVDAQPSETESGIWKGVKLGPLEIASRCLISSTCRRCPVCKSTTNKDGGCNHIHCTVCGSEWCWICLKTWSANCQSAHWF